MLGLGRCCELSHCGRRRSAPARRRCRAVRRQRETRFQASPFERSIRPWRPNVNDPQTAARQAAPDRRTGEASVPAARGIQADGKPTASRRSLHLCALLPCPARSVVPGFSLAEGLSWTSGVAPVAPVVTVGEHYIPHGDGRHGDDAGPGEGAKDGVHVACIDRRVLTMSPLAGPQFDERAHSSTRLPRMPLHDATYQADRRDTGVRRVGLPREGRAGQPSRGSRVGHPASPRRPAGRVPVKLAVGLSIHSLGR